MPRDHFVSQRAVANILAQLLLILHHKYKYTDKLKHTLTSVYKYMIPYKAAASPKKVLCYDVLADSCQVHSVCSKGTFALFEKENLNSSVLVPFFWSLKGCFFLFWLLSPCLLVIQNICELFIQSNVLTT